MSHPITARLPDDIIKAIDEAVKSGVAANRGALISKAINEWLSKHSEDAIRESYRKRYASSNQSELELVTKLGLASAAMTISQTSS
ncbi:MAG: ribbon-helix-helix domain-containing protein [Actinomycetota bacterium]|jgi:Arc/MetJ-type ribon-helix-helix transcriptional regulator|nr:ribbon-helix-helix domain-containing protein [Actinomycetota bacterium]